MDRKKTKETKQIIVDFNGQVKDIKQQFFEQLKCLDVRTESEVALLGEIQEYFKRRAEVELEYSKNLDRLSKQVDKQTSKHKIGSEQWCTLYTIWDQLHQDSKIQAKNHLTISEIYSNTVQNKIQQQSEAVQRVAKKCKEIGFEAQTEIAKVLGQLHTALKTYQTCYGEFSKRESKFKAVDAEVQKYDAEHPKKQNPSWGSKRHRLGKNYDEKKRRYIESKLKATKTRNEYLLCIEGANAALQRFFADDVSDILDCMDVGLTQWLGSVFKSVHDANKFVNESKEAHVRQMTFWLESLDPRLDKQKFLEGNHSLFMLPRRFEFKPHKGDELRQVCAQKPMQDELIKRHHQFEQSLANEKLKTDEDWKTLEETEKNLLKSVSEPEFNVLNFFQLSTSSRKLSVKESNDPGSLQKRKQDMMQLEEFYLIKFRDYCIKSNLIHRSNAKHEMIKRSLGLVHSSNGVSNFHASSPYREQSSQSSSNDDLSVGSNALRLGGISKTKRIGRSHRIGKRPKLFGGNLTEYVEATGEEIPIIIRSCVRMLSLYGLHHQGVFRVSGSQIEINCLKDSFEKGDDPLADITDATEVSVPGVAGVLKLYFRELNPPLFPTFLFEQFIECSKIMHKDTFIENIQELLKCISRPVYVTMRYLFAFLNHLSEFCDENMMNAYNLATCFGPTLVSIPDKMDQVVNHNFINELAKNMIVWSEDIFVDDGGLVYEKYLLDDKSNREGDTEPDGNISEDETAPLEFNGSDEDILAVSLEGFPCIDNCHLMYTSIDAPSNTEHPMEHTAPIYANVALRRSTPTPRNASHVSAYSRTDDMTPSPSARPSSMLVRPASGAETAVWMKRDPAPLDLLQVDPDCGAEGSYSSQSSGLVPQRRTLPHRQPSYQDTTEHQAFLRANSLATEALKYSRGVNPSSTTPLTAPIVDSPTFQFDHTSSSVASSSLQPENAENNNLKFAKPNNSPLALKEIQVELKAVLNSLESFTQQAKLRHNAPSARSPTSSHYTPDLVQNLPTSIDESQSTATSGSSEDPSSPCPTPPPPEPGPVLIADKFAESRESTIRKGRETATVLAAPRPASLVAAMENNQCEVVDMSVSDIGCSYRKNSVGSTSSGEVTTERTSNGTPAGTQRQKPPVPRKPMLNGNDKTQAAQLLSNTNVRLSAKELVEISKM